MAVDRRSERSALRGLLVPDTGLSFDSAQSTLTQAGPRAGLPIPDRRTTTALVATGDQTTAFDVEVERGGSIGDGLQIGSRLTYSHDGEDYGWDQPVAIRGWELVRSSIYEEWLCDAISLRDEVLITVVGLTFTGPIGGLAVRRRVHGGAWSTPYNSTADDATEEGSVRACFCLLPSGRVLLHYCELTFTEGLILWVLYSDDDGATWSTPTRVALDTELAVNNAGLSVTGYSECLGMASAYHDGDVVLFLSTRRAKVDMGANVSRDGLIQLASSNLGQSFRLVDESDYAASSWNGGALGSVVTTKSGQILLTFVSADTSPSVAKVCRLSSAYQPFTSHGDEDLGSGLFAGETTAAPSSGVQMADFDLTTCLMDDGTLWTYTRYLNVLSPTFSEDGGVSWDLVRDLDGNVATVCDTENTDSYLKNCKATSYRNAVALAHNWAADSGFGSGKNTAVAFLGGYANRVFGGSAPDRWSWQRNWIAIDAPSDVGWSVSGAGTVSLGDDRLTIATTGVQTKVYTESFSPEECLTVRASLAVTSGGIVSQTVYLRVTTHLSGQRYITEVRVGTAAISVRDVTGTFVHGSLAIDTTGGVDLLIAAVGQEVTVWVAPRVLGGEQTYTEVATGLNTGFAAIPLGEVEFGHGGVANSEWFEVSVAYGDETAIALDDLPGALLSPHPVYTWDGVYLRGEGGPAWTGDSWTITPRYDFGIERTDPVDSPSPRRGWRSSTDADDCYLAFSDGGAERHWAGQLLGFGFFGVNFSIGEIQTRSPAGTWSTLCDFSSSQPGLIQLAYTRNGSTIVPASSTGGNPQLRLDELKGASIYLASGVVRRIVSNSAGKWSTASGSQRPVITIEVDGLDELTAASGTASIVPRDFVVITRAPATEITGVRVYLEGQDTAEGWFELGTLIAGHVEVFADDYSWGRVEDVEPSVERTRLRGGTTRTRVLAPPQRRVTFNWAEGVDTSRVEGEEPDPDYLTSSSIASSPTVATIGSTPYQIAGLISYLDSGKVPVVYLPQIPLGSTGVDTHTLNRRDQILLAQVTSHVSLESVQGDECDDEVWRVAQVELEEVV